MAERSRPEMTQEQYDQLMSHLEERYRDESQPARVRVYQRFFYLWCAPLDATGIRPWKSAGNAYNSSSVTAIGSSAAAAISHANCDGTVAVGADALATLTSSYR